MKKRKPTTCRRGLETVEAALVLPILLLITFGAFKYGWLFLKTQQLANAARQVARVAVRPGNRSADITIQFNDLMTQANISGATCEVDPLDGVQTVGYPVSVHVFVPIANVDIIPLLPWPGTGVDGNLGTTITMSKEGPYSGEN